MTSSSLAAIAVSAIAIATPAAAQDAVMPPAAVTQPPEAAVPAMPDVPASPVPEAAAPQAPESATPPGRYTFSRVNDSLLRLDSLTGQVAVCSRRSAGWACEAVPEERAAFEREIERLQGEVAGLRSDVAALRAPPAPPRPPADLLPPAAKAPPAVTMPTREDLERAKAIIDKAWRRLVDMIVDIKNDVMKKG